MHVSDRANRFSTRRSRGRSGGPVVVIVGGSRGIGRAAAEEFAGRGARLVLAGRDVLALDAARRACEARGALVSAMPADVTDPRSIEELVDSVVDRFGRIDVWVASASVMSFGTVLDTPPEVFTQIIETNLLGQVNTARAVVPLFMRQGGGTIVFIGSLYSRLAAPYVAPYVASKHALLGFVRSLRQEMRGARGVRIRLVLPASVDTAIYQRSANATGRRPRPLPPVVHPRRVARAIVRATNRRARDTRTVGLLQTLALPFQVLLPRLYDRAARSALETFGLGGPAPATTGAVLTPLAEEGGVTGGWRMRGARIVLAASAVAAVVAATRRRR